MKRRGKPNEQYEILTVSEAKERKIAYLEDWRQVIREGDWIKTDDGYVAQVIKLGYLNTKLQKDGYVGICTGTFLMRKGVELTTEKRECRSTFDGKFPNKTIRLNERVKEFVQLYASGIDRITAYMQVWPTDEPRYARVRSDALLKHEGVKKLLREEVKTALEKLGIDDEWLLTKYKTVVENTRSDTARLRAMDSLSEITGLKSKDTQKTSVTLFQGLDSNELAALKETTQGGQLPASAEIEDAEYTEGEGIEESSYLSFWR